MDISALFKLSYGLYIAGTATDEGLGGCIVDAVAQVSMAEPPNIILGSMVRNETNARIKTSGRFSLSILPEGIDPFVVANFGFQSSRDVDKWVNVPHEVKEGLPVLSGAVAHIALKVNEAKELGTHTLFICEVTDAWQDAGGRPLIYADYLEKMKDDAFKAFQKFKEEK